MRRVVHFLIIFWMVLGAWAGELKIPEPLKEWKEWVLYGVDDLFCPDYFNGKESKRCLWYRDILFDPTSKTLSFTIKNFSKKELEIPLILADSGWVESPKLDGFDSPIAEKRDTPTLLVPTGEHKISFQISPKNDIKYLKLPKQIVGLEVVGRGFVPKDKSSRLWLVKRVQKSSKNEQFEVSIYRKIIDSKPMRVDTYLHFRVSGGVKYIKLNGILLDGFLAESIKTPLKASISRDNSLKVELKAGEWSLLVSSYSNQKVKEFKIPKYNFKPSNSEVWFFQENPKYRTVRIKGVKAIDPQNLNIPKAWKRLSAYLINKESIFKIEELYKTKLTKESNHFTLKREVWLDFNGSGYSIFDQIDSTLAFPTRLETLGSFDLLSLSINGKPQVISSVKGGGLGVELREKRANITTSSRSDGNISSLPVNSWNQKFDSGSLNLNLPPAWRVLGSTGSDRHSNLWIDKWNLFDIFLLLLLSVIIYKLFGLKYAILGFLAGVVFWQEPKAPTVIWIILALLIALIRVLPDGRMRTMVNFLIISTVISLGFKIYDFGLFELRASLYPQLEKEVYSLEHNSFDEVESASLTPLPSKAPQSISFKRESYYKTAKKREPQYQKAISGDEKVQTGIAKPFWSWNKYQFYWDGTLAKGQKLQLLIVPPLVTRVWRVLSLFGVVFLLFLFLRDFIRDSNRRKTIRPNIIAIFLALFFTIEPSFSKTPTTPKTPSQEILSELKKRVLQSAKECQNMNCASIERVKVTIVDSKLKVEMKISSSQNLYIPTIERVGVWMADTVFIDDNSSVFRVSNKKGDSLLLLPKGVHKVEFIGSLEKVDRILLESKLPIRLFETQAPKGWRVTLSSKHFIEILRVTQSQKIPNSQIAPFVSLKREFHFENSWYIITTVTLLNSIQKPYILKYPLLDGESIIDQNIKTESKKATIYLTREQKSIVFKSILPIKNLIHLKAHKAQNREILSQEWLIDAKGNWHIDYKGLEPSSSQVVGNRLLLRFKPWVGEALDIKVSSTTPKIGSTLTIESSKLLINQSQSYRDLSLDLSINSAIASKYPITIDNLDELKSIKIGTREYFLKPKNGKLELPLRAGRQKITIKWREKHSCKVVYEFPTIDLHRPSTNSIVELKMNHSRWILFASGSLFSPAVLIWGVMLSILILALILSKTLGSPPTTLDWAILGLGISTISSWGLVPIIIWIILLKLKAYQDDELRGTLRNFVQVGIIVFAILSLISIIASISIGLLSNPEMLIRGNGSSSYDLIWYRDFIDGLIFKPTLISLSLWYYKIIMLFWSLWVSFKLIAWIESGWKIFVLPPIWDKRVK